VSEVGLELDLKEAKSTDVFHVIRILGLHDSDKNTVATASMDNSCSYFMLDESVVSVDSGSNLNKSVTWSLGRQWSGSCLYNDSAVPAERVSSTASSDKSLAAKLVVSKSREAMTASGCGVVVRGKNLTRQRSAGAARKKRRGPVLSGFATLLNIGTVVGVCVILDAER